MVFSEWAEKVKSFVFLVNAQKRMNSEECSGSGYMTLLMWYKFVFSPRFLSKELLDKVVTVEGRLHGISNMNF